jgi:uncharacterized protein
MAHHRRPRPLVRACGAAVLLLVSACSAAEDAGTTADPASTKAPGSSTPSSSATVGAESTISPKPRPTPVHPISLEAITRADLPGGGLRLGAVRERVAGYTSYDVSFRSTTAGRGTRPLRITGVLNVPDGRGPFPAVVLAHGYIDPAIYVRGQGMTRERGYLADRGFVALHVDYRNHAGSDDDPRVDTAVRLGYTADVVAAARALRRSSEVRVDPRRISLFGRSMGGGVMLKALTAEPGLFSAGVGWASVSSLEAENFQQFIADDASRAELRASLRKRHGLPQDDPAFWRGLSPRPVFDRITEPVLLVHGRYDDTCPPRWARESHRALRSAGVDSTLEWYEDGHAFGPAFNAAMDRVVRFVRSSRSG